MNRLSCIVPVMASVIVTAVAAQARPTYDVATDFSIASNPNGVWNYAFSQTLGGPITLLDNPFNNTGANRGWYSTQINSLGTPSVFQNQSASSFFGVAPGAVGFHPGPDGSIAAFTLIRFVAPATSTYTIAAQWFAGDTGNTDAYILRNSLVASPLFSQSTTNTNPAYNQSLSLTAGETLDFVVGTGGDNYFSDTTPINITINSAAVVPEADAGILFGIGGTMLCVAGVVVRRRIAR